jgi:cysteine-rich repeat protein
MTRKFVPLAFSLLAAASSCGGSVDVKFTGAAGACGDGALGTSETCDDGNDAGGDGCSADCQVEPGYLCQGSPSVCEACSEAAEAELAACDGADDCHALCSGTGSCETPYPLALVPEGLAVTAQQTADLSAGSPSQIEAPDCGAGTTGAGADAVFVLQLPQAADLHVRVTSTFDSVVQVLTAPCDPAERLANACSNRGGVAEEEEVVLSDVAAGTYYVAVSGANPQQAGSFTVRVAARCPLSHLKIDRLVVDGAAKRTVLWNSSEECSIDLSRVGVRAEPEATNSPQTLPERELGALAKVVLTNEEPTPDAQLFHGSLPYTVTTGGAYYVCRGACDENTGANVLDAVVFEGLDGLPSGQRPSGLQFDGALPVLTQPEVRSYWRVAYEGRHPEFKASDWLDAFVVETFDDRTMSRWTEDGAAHQERFEAIEGTTGRYSLRLSGGGAPGAGFRRVLRTHAGSVVSSVQPSYVSYRVRAAEATANQGALYLGGNAAGFEGRFIPLFLTDGAQVCAGTPSGAGCDGTLIGDYTAETWTEVVLRDFVYGPTNFSASAEVNGTASVSPVTGTSDALRQLYLFHPAAATVHYDHIIVR